MKLGEKALKTHQEMNIAHEDVSTSILSFTKKFPTRNDLVFLPSSPKSEILNAREKPEHSASTTTVLMVHKII